MKNKTLDVGIDVHLNELLESRLLIQASSGGGRFNKLLGAIRSLGLVSKRGSIEPTDLLYPEGLE